MGQDRGYHGKLSVLVNTCDAYEDLWHPFFTLLKKYLPIDVPIYLNTETMDFQMEGLNVRCVHPPARYQKCPYGKRMQLALKHINTEYVLLLLDDFFLRKPVNEFSIETIIAWMDADPDIACFNSEATKTYVDWEVDTYPGFRRIPAGNRFTLNMQAAVWRTKALSKYWKSNVTPWEWELFCNALTTKYPKDKFYCALKEGTPFIDYGHYHVGDIWGIVKGKWIVPDVKPLFDREGIVVDFSLRGEYLEDCSHPYVSPDSGRLERYKKVFRCLGIWDVFKFFGYCRVCNIRTWLHLPIPLDYFAYLQEKAQRRYLLNKRK